MVRNRAACPGQDLLADEGRSAEAAQQADAAVALDDLDVFVKWARQVSAVRPVAVPTPRRASRNGDHVMDDMIDQDPPGQTADDGGQLKPSPI